MHGFPLTKLCLQSVKVKETQQCKAQSKEVVYKRVSVFSYSGKLKPCPTQCA